MLLSLSNQAIKPVGVRCKPQIPKCITGITPSGVTIIVALPRQTFATALVA